MRTQVEGAADDMADKLFLAAELLGPAQPRLRETLKAAAELLEIMECDLTETERALARLEKADAA